MFYPPFFVSDNKLLNEAFRIAVGDIAGNIVPYRGGVLKQEEPCLMAGLDYEQPWTRDTAINITYALALMDGDVCKNTLLSVLEEKNGKTVVAGSYGQTWDNVIWTVGAYEYLQFHNDDEFLRFAFEVSVNTLHEYEKSSFSQELNLFSGQAVYADGIASYPDNIVRKIESNQPIYALSTNCVYYRVYRICAEMAAKLGLANDEYTEKAEKLKLAVVKHFRNDGTGLFDYFAGESDAQEGLGLAYAVLYDIADKEQSVRFFANAHITPNGVTCEWPPFSRYTSIGNGEYGRHCGTVWTLISGAWALAALKAADTKSFERELFLLAEKAVRDLSFYEIYHPDTGLPYGGLQEWEGEIVKWTSCRKQSWSATAFLAMLYRGIAGIRVENGVLTVTPYLPNGVNEITLKNIRIADKTFTLKVVKGKKYPKTFTGKPEDIDKEILLSF